MHTLQVLQGPQWARVMNYTALPEVRGTDAHDLMLTMLLILVLVWTLLACCVLMRLCFFW